jgi:hypothetical protein
MLSLFRYFKEPLFLRFREPDMIFFPFHCLVPPFELGLLYNDPFRIYKLLGKTAVSFSTERTTPQIINELVEGRPVIVSGRFPGFPTRKTQPLGHVVCLVGCEWQQDNAKNPVAGPDFFIIDDPYGDTLNDWKGSGNDIRLDAETFYNWMRPEKDRGIKWGHFLKSPKDAEDWVPPPKRGLA